ncbi:MAG: MBL fold metallo-hydrolase [Proteobacteria bacterium]|nr:MBL fold metallo-hydrolase [Pseudomonadota bacterium]
MNRIAIAALAGAAFLAPALASRAQTNYAAVQIKPTDLGRHTWMLEGNGGNITVVEGADAVIMVDTQFAPLHDKIKAAIAELAHKPIRYVVDTHLHGDHTGGNQAFWMDGATLVGQDLLKKSMAEGTTNALSGAKTPPAPAAALPTVTYAERTTLAVKGRRVELIHVPRAHTRGDTIVWIPDADVLATGDIVSVGGRYPNIDVGDGGGIEGMIAGVDACLKHIDAKTKVVPGHGPLMDREAVKTYRQVLVDARDAVKALKAQGMSEDQVVAAKPLAAIQTRVGATDQASVNFARLIYKSL